MRRAGRDPVKTSARYINWTWRKPQGLSAKKKPCTLWGAQGFRFPSFPPGNLGQDATAHDENIESANAISSALYDVP